MNIELFGFVRKVNSIVHDILVVISKPESQPLPACVENVPTRIDVAAGQLGSSATSSTKIKEVIVVKIPSPKNSARKSSYRTLYC